ncbi:MAG: UDP-2,4-diacetamido-2,4,6-trideoxy-beta-L-altropyranose hydrolase [Lachnospiraceae bacterium]|nr:UDP-2,4-diacetamido-2,4,6-trideoxy-beta-L-altropyranose hydrolase [Lachnospiraceae bacterium]
MVFIRTDANSKIGMGHLMRCLTIGKALTEAGENVVFLVSDSESENALRSSGAVYFNLSVNWDDISADELDAVRSIADRESHDGKVPIFLVDSYHLNDNYLKELRKSAIVAYIDDFLDSTKEADIIINYDVLARKEKAAALYDGYHTRLLVGTVYAPLREQFFNVRKREKFYAEGDGRVCNVLLCGGGGAASFLPKIAEHILNTLPSENLKLAAVAGEYSDAFAELETLEKEHPGRISALKNVVDMKSLMEDCSIAVTAAGTVPYECCATGLPAVLYSISDDQLPDARWLKDNGIMFYAGDIRDRMDIALENISGYLKKLMESPELQSQMAKKSRKITDGKGAVRIARAMLRFRETGSFFEITGNDRAYKDNNIFRFLEDCSQDVRYYDSGRSAFSAALQSIESSAPEERSKRCLLPVYTCDTVILPFEEAGWEVFYYHVNRELEPDPEEIDELIRKTGSSLVLFHTYFGMDTLDNMSGYINALREKKISVIEDMTQSLFMTGAAVKRSDFVVGSIRKWMEIPDGGFGIGIISEEGETLEFEGGAFVSRRLDAMKEKGDYLLGLDGAVKAHFLRENTGSESDRYDDFMGAYSMSLLSSEMAEGVDAKDIASRRSENARFLDGALSVFKSVRKVRDLKDGEVPLYYPVYADDREGLQTLLREHDIYAPVLWPVYENAKKSFDDNARYIYSHLLALPCDQRYDVRTMENMVKLISYHDS